MGFSGIFYIEVDTFWINIEIFCEILTPNIQSNIKLKMELQWKKFVLLD